MAERYIHGPVSFTSVAKITIIEGEGDETTLKVMLLRHFQSVNINNISEGVGGRGNAPCLHDKKKLSEYMYVYYIHRWWMYIVLLYAQI